MARWLTAAALLVITIGVPGCKGSPTPSNPEGGVADRPSSADSSGTCTNDDGTRNKTKGQECSCNQQCATGFCADGYCCDTACEGTCMSCGLRTALGTCTVTPAGLKPRTAAQCAAQDPGTCGFDGTCDGTGKCRKYEAGAVCKAGACDGDAVTNTFVCDGAGACKLGAATVCAPYSCSATTKQCFPACTSDAECVSGRKCVGGSCGKKMNGALCPMGDVECASGHCADGVCCNTGCGGACRSCNLVGQLGTCSPISAGKGHPLCLQTAPSSCGTTGVCDGFGTCSLYPATSPCGGSSCVLPANAAMNTAQTCDGLGACQPSEVQSCGGYKCANNACNSKCTVNADCADGIACVNGSCGPKLDGQKCAAGSECQNKNCVDGVCCNTACTGGCRSCALTGTVGKCTMSANGASDPRATCKDMGAATCGTDGKCDGTGTCRKYPAGTTVCSPEVCVSDVYTGPSTCNASGQCIKPTATACFPYHCNATKCFSACTTTADCITPNICGMNGVISSCGLKPNGAACNVGTECSSSFCAQGFCCNSACNTACKSCSLSGSVGSCTNVPSGVDPQGMCAIQASTTCGTTGSCSAGACARWVSGTQCVPASCPSTSTRAPASTCNGTGTCVTPATMSCAPGRCTGAACVNSCVTSADCTAPATCVSGSCGLQPKGGACTGPGMCLAGLTCYLSEGANGVCCDTACSGTCESCKLAGSVGTCTAVPAGATDPDPATACVAGADPTTCGLNGRCSGNNTGANGAGTSRCQFQSSTQGCRNRSCTPGTAVLAATETAAATCNGSGTCGAVVSTSCAPYNKCIGTTQCASSCTTNADCVGVTCNTKTGHCGEKLGTGASCGTGTDCTSGFCADGVCCNGACGGACQACNVTGSVGTCTNVSGQPPTGAPHPGCAATAPCGTTGQCNNGVCATASGQCAGPACVGSTLTGASSCSGTTSTCPAGVSMSCPNGLKCAANGVSCLDGCTSPSDCAGTGVTCNTITGVCGQKLALGAVCGAGPDCTSENCVDGRCCSSACNGTCEACNNPGSLGTCSAVTMGTLDTAHCPTTMNGCMTNTGTCAAGGTCAKVGMTTACQPASCTSPGAGATATGTCSGSGTCISGTTTSCGNYSCNAAATACNSTCTTSADCIATRQCIGGACVVPPPPLAAVGEACSANGDCANGQCVDGTCCGTASCGGCDTCASTGMCHARQAGSNPVPMSFCTAAPPCGNTGTCDGSSLCTKAPSTVTCGTLSCSGSTLTQPGNCSGTGMCTQASGPCPGNFSCETGTTCRQDCNADPMCAPGTSCTPGSPGTCTVI